jgi:hypothetical protein
MKNSKEKRSWRRGTKYEQGEPGLSIIPQQGTEENKTNTKSH